MVIGKQRSKVDDSKETSSPNCSGEDIFLEAEAKIPGALDIAVDESCIKKEIVSQIKLIPDGEISASITRTGISLKGTAKLIAPLVVPIISVIGLTCLFSSAKIGSALDFNRIAGGIGIVLVSTTHMALHRKG